MTPLRLSVFAACLLFAASGCSLFGDDDPPYDGPLPLDLAGFSRDSTQIVGTWEWRRSMVYNMRDGGFIVSTPESTGETETLVFTEDIAAEEYRNGALERRAEYATWQQLFRDWYAGPPVVRGDTLVTDSMPRDGPQTVYTRTR